MADLKVVTLPVQNPPKTGVIRRGDLVRLKGQYLEMTVERIYRRRARCQWHGEMKDPCEAEYPVDILELVKSGKPDSSKQKGKLA